jgi:cell wall-associated NlpC family hydrolase
MAKRTFAAILMAGTLSGIIPMHAQGASPDRPPLEQIAKKYVGVQYNWEGRLTNSHPGLDCLGLLFVALEKKYEIPWKTWSVKPSELINQLDKKHDKRTILLTDTDEKGLVKSLKPGDMLFFLRPVILSGDTPVAKNSKGKDFFVWHTALYEGDGKMVHASPFPDSKGEETYKVIEENVLQFMKNNAFDGLIAVTFSKK